MAVLSSVVGNLYNQAVRKSLLHLAPALGHSRTPKRMPQAYSAWIGLSASVAHPPLAVAHAHRDAVTVCQMGCQSLSYPFVVWISEGARFALHKFGGCEGLKVGCLHGIGRWPNRVPTLALVLSCGRRQWRAAQYLHEALLQHYWDERKSRTQVSVRLPLVCHLTSSASTPKG